jgi:ThiF family protein
VIDTSRMLGSIDAKLMHAAKIVCIGIGGSNQICENLVRSNLGNLVCIDFDIVDETNIATQGYYFRDISRLKVDALGDRLAQLNPNVNYMGLNSDFLKLTDDEIESIVSGADLLLFMTDNFYAQAKGNLIALKYRIPSIFAMMYEKARCSEIFFWIPKITPGCFRCAVSSRYEAHYNNNFVNDVKAQAFTIFHVQYLNSIIGLLALAILHRNSIDLELSNWFGDYWDRNFIQIRMHSNYSMSENNLFFKTFQNNPRVFNFDAIWQKIEKECPPKYSYSCPDCGG